MTELKVKMSEMTKAKIDQAASDYEDKISHPRHWDCCYHSGDTEKHFANGAKWALELPEVKVLVEALEFYRDDWNKSLTENTKKYCDEIETLKEEAQYLKDEIARLREAIVNATNAWYIKPECKCFLCETLAKGDE